MRYETSPGSIHTDNSAGTFSKMSVMGTPLSRAARSNTASVGSPVFKHRNAEPCIKCTEEEEKNKTSEKKESVEQKTNIVGGKPYNSRRMKY